MKLHIEMVYGIYHGSDPRCFTPDEESCTEAELNRHRSLCTELGDGPWLEDPTDSGCHITRDEDGKLISILTKSALGLGAYKVVMSDQGDYVRDATYEDSLRESEWEDETC